MATDAGADDIVPAKDEDDHLEGYKVTLTYCFVLCAIAPASLTDIHRTDSYACSIFVMHGLA